jgi:AraC-like DNA-binding protein
VVLLLEMPPEEGILAAARLSSLRCRAVVRVGPELPAILRDVLTDPANLGRDVIDWLRLRSIRLNPHQADLLEKIFTDAPDHGDLTALLARHHIPPSTARFRLRKRGLPSPNRCFQAARAIHAVLRLLAQPELPVATVARRLRFADHSALAHLLRRSLGVTSQEIRGTLGWEWLLDRWLRSSRTPLR